MKINIKQNCQIKLNGFIKVFKVFDEKIPIKQIIEKQKYLKINNTLTIWLQRAILQNLQMTFDKICGNITIGKMGLNGNTGNETLIDLLEPILPNKNVVVEITNYNALQSYVYFSKNEGNENLIKEFGLFGTIDDSLQNCLFERIVLSPFIQKNNSFGLLFQSNIDFKIN